MHVYLRSSRYTKEVTGVTLLDGCVPAVGNQPPPKRPDGKPIRIEPAVWFKVLIIDSVSIDCQHRQVKWSSNVNELCDTRSLDSSDSISENKMKSKLLLGEGTCDDEDQDMDELFESVQKSLEDLASGTMDYIQFNDMVLKLLHLHILPAIKLTVDDIMKVSQTYRYIEEKLADVDENILQKTNQIQELIKAMDKQRSNHINELLHEKIEKGKYRADFAELLYSHIEKEIKKSWEKFEGLQDEVNKTRKRKEDLTVSTVEDICLKHKRKERDVSYSEYERLVTARENLRLAMNGTHKPAEKKSLKETLKSIKFSKKSEPKPLYDIYIEMARKLDDLMGQHRQLIDRKLMILSMKEAVRATLAELRSGQDSLGIDFDRSGKTRATDVLRHSSVPLEWQTLSGQVASIIKDVKTELGKKHAEFCASIIQQCEAAMFEKDLLEMSNVGDRDSNHSKSSWYVEHEEFECSSSSSQVTESRNEGHPWEHSNTLIQLEGQIENEDIVIVHNTEQNHMKKTIDRLKRTIIAHFDTVCKGMQETLRNPSNFFYRKVWLCYETHFYEKTMQHLVRLYEKAYASIVHSLEQAIPLLTTKDLDIQGTSVAGMLEHCSQMVHKDDGGPADHAVRENSWCPDVTSDQTRVKRLGLVLEEGEESLVTEQILESQQSQSLPSTENSQELISGNACDQEDAAGAQSSNLCITEAVEFLSLASPTTMRRQRSQPNANTEPVKRITVHYPTSITMLVNRSTWPLPQQWNSAPDELGTEALEVTNFRGNTGHNVLQCRPPVLRKHRVDSDAGDKPVRLSARYRSRFDEAISCINGAINEVSPLHKLQYLTRCQREISKQLSDFQDQEFSRKFLACSDDLIDVVIVLLCNCDVHDAVRLYPHLMLLADVMAPFLEAGPHSYSLIQFLAAYQFIQDRMVLKTRQS